MQSPVRVKILTMLREQEMAFEEIVARSGRAKSTISVHLKDMVQEGILDSSADPRDGRRKLFRIRSEYLGTLSPADRVDDDIGSYILAALQTEDDPSGFFRALFRAIRLSLLHEGVIIDPILHRAGLRVGETVYELVRDTDLQQMIRNLAALWARYRLGRLELASTDPLTITIQDCFECQDLPRLGRSACAFDTGVLTAVFQAHFREEQKVTETRCYAMGDTECRFIVESRTPGADIAGVN